MTGESTAIGIYLDSVSIFAGGITNSGTIFVSSAADTTGLHVGQIVPIMRDGARLSLKISRLYNQQVAGYAVGSDGKVLKGPKGKKKLVVTLVGKILP